MDAQSSLLSGAAASIFILTILRRQRRKRRARKVRQMGQHGAYQALLSELQLTDQASFRNFLRMDVSSFHELLAKFDEIEALSSIYGDAWHVEDEASRVFSVDVISEADAEDDVINLQIEMPETYPTHSPPMYTLNAPWLRGREREKLETSLQEIYSENLGNSIIYLWVERIREFLEIRRTTTNLKEDSAEDDLEDVAFFFDHVELNEAAEAGEESAYPCPEIHHGDPLSDRKSKFVAHLAHVIHPSQVKLVLDKLKENKKIADATHNILAYRISQGENSSSFYTGCEDDGETKAGSRLLHLLHTVDASDVLIVVTRWYGGVHLGPDRFKHISGLARIILEQCGYIKEKTSKKGSKSGNKKQR